MLDPEVLDRVLQTCSYRFRSVICPVDNKPAKITAAKFPTDEADWSVTECSLLPGQDVDCSMRCLFQDREFVR